MYSIVTYLMSKLVLHLGDIEKESDIEYSAVL